MEIGSSSNWEAPMFGIVVFSSLSTCLMLFPMFFEY